VEVGKADRPPGDEAPEPLQQAPWLPEPPELDARDNLAKGAQPVQVGTLVDEKAERQIVMPG
jgi:hypothetical protein